MSICIFGTGFGASTTAAVAGRERFLELTFLPKSNIFLPADPAAAAPAVRWGVVGTGFPIENSFEVAHVLVFLTGLLLLPSSTQKLVPVRVGAGFTSTSAKPSLDPLVLCLNVLIPIGFLLTGTTF